jgi:hypothetical protein
VFYYNVKEKQGMEFEKYEKDKAGRGGIGPRVSMRKSGSIGINGEATKQYFDDVDWVTLYFSNQENAVGIKPEDSNVADSYSLQKRNGEGYGGSINATSFMREYDLLPNKTKQYRASWSDEMSMVIADLSDPVLVYDSN